MAREVPDVLRAYAKYVKENDAAQIFHLWVGIGVIASVAQRKISMRFHGFDVHSNMYILLVSPAGRGRKSTALRMGRNLLIKVIPEINFAAQSGSFEGIVKIFSEIKNPSHQSLTLVSSELGSLMSTMPERMMDFMNDIWDGNINWDRMTISHAKQTIAKPWLHFMGGTTPRWISDNAGLLAAEGGWLARMIIPYSDERILDNPAPEPTPELLKLESQLVNTLSHIALLEGEFKFEGGREGEAYQWYSSWYKDESRFPDVEDPRTAGYFDRKHVNLLKVAMAAHLSYDDELVISVRDLETALTLLDATEPGMRIALRALGKNEWASALVTIFRMIKHKGRISYKELIIENIHNVPKRKMDELLEELVYMGEVRYQPMGGVAYYVWKGYKEPAAEA